MTYAHMQGFPVHFLRSQTIARTTYLTGGFGELDAIEHTLEIFETRICPGHMSSSQGIMASVAFDHVSFDSFRLEQRLEQDQQECHCAESMTATAVPHHY
jgi:hypothetical protein